jgi:hypothetical protein
MKHSRVLLASSVVAVVASAPVALPAQAASDYRDRTVEIVRVSEQVIDLGTPGNSHGDIRVTRGIVRSESGKRIGTYATSQVTVQANVSGQREERSLIMRVTMGKGEVTMVGMIVAPDGLGPSAKFTVPIAGGSGSYDNAGGTMTLIPRGNGVSTLKFDFA